MKIIVLASCLLVGSVYGQTETIDVSESQPVTIGIVTDPPFAILDGESLKGSDIEISNLIAENSRWNVEYVKYDRFADLFNALDEKRVDAIMNGITINLDREQKYDFSQPYMNTGLGIMTLEDRDIGFARSISSWLQVRIPLFADIFIICLMFLGELVFFGVLLYMTDDQHKQDSADDDGLTLMEFFKGSANSIWLAFTTGSTIGYGDVYPKRALARIIAVICFFSVAILVGSLTASITSFSVAQQFEARIDGPSDLKGKKVAAVEGSTSVDKIRFYGGTVREYDNYDQCISSLIMGRVDAVVGDVPNLAFFANGEGQDIVAMASVVFAPQSYGIAFAEGSDLVEQANRAILASEKDIQAINRRYYGK